MVQFALILGRGSKEQPRCCFQQRNVIFVLSELDRTYEYDFQDGRHAQYS
jgi:hypothetical protein